MRTPTLDAVHAKMVEHTYEVFDGEFDLNLIALRATPNTLDSFDDLFVCSYRKGGQWRFFAWPCTTEPGRPAIKDPRRSDGTAVITLGQHRAAYTFGKHKGQYECLVPARPIDVLRDKNRDDVVDGSGGKGTSSTVQIHRANPDRRSTVVGKWSEGCIVLADPADLANLLYCCHQQESAGIGRVFSLTILPWPAA